MDFFSPIRRLNWRFREQPASKRPASKKRLSLEPLEARELLAVAPFVTNVTPATGGTLGASIVVTYSENVTGAATASNYRLFDSSGAPVAIGIVSYNPTTFEATISAASLNGGAPLVAGNYSLFLRGDQIIDVDDNLPVSRPGEIVVANSGRGNVSTVSLQGDGALGALTNLPLPPKGTATAAPTAIALEDINADGVRDLLVGNTGFNTVSIFLGGANGEFASVPDAELNLGPSGTPTDFAIGDLNADSKNDIIVTSSGTNSVQVFLNTATGTEISFAAGVSYASGNVPNGIVLGRFNNDNFLDIAVSNGTANGSNNYTVNVLTGRGDGTFNATVELIVGNTTPTNLTTPTGIALGRFNGDALDDLAVSGGSGISVLTNTSTTATPTFTTAFVGRTITTAGTVATSVTTGVFRNNANTQQDILVATNDNGGQLILYVNNGAGAFQATGAVAAGAAAPSDVTARDLTGDTRPEIVYTNNTATGGVVSQAPLQAGLVETASNGSPIVITSTAHGLANGQRVTVAGAGGNTAANGTFYIANVTANTFELVGTTGNGAHTAGTGTWVAVPGTITNVTGNGTSPIVITSPNHGLRSGQQVTVANVGGNTAANGTFFITRISATQFSLNGTTGNGAYTANTGTWSLAPYPTGGGAVRLALGDTNADGIIDVVTANQTANSVAYYRGSGTAGVGDGTFLAASNMALTSTTPVPNSVAVGDVNNDGIPDLVVSDFSSNRVNVLLGLAQGGYATAVSFTTQVGNLGRQPVSVALGDLDEDGNLDIVVASQQDNVVSVLRGGGNGTFQAPTTVSVGRTPTEVALGDFDEDGHLDLLVAHNGGGFGGGNRGVTFRRGVGDGTFFAAQEIATGTRAAGLALGDFNRDGNLDFAVIDNNAPGRVRIRLGDGVGGFTNGGDFTVGSNPIDIQAADMNSDGFVDIVTVSSSGTTTNNVSVLINALGTGFQTAINTTLAAGTPLRSVAVVNANGDPFPDLVVGAAVPPGDPTPPQPNNVQVLLGQGNGTFQVDTDLFTAGGTGTPELVPSYVAVVNDALVPLTTFVVGGNLISADLVRNGNFDARDLTAEDGNLTGWRTFRLNDPNRGSAGQWSAQTGSLSPLSLTQVISPASGRYQAMLDQQHLRPFLPGGPGGGNPNSDDSYAGSHAIYQDIFIPANVTSALLSLRLYINSADPLSDTNSISVLDYRVTGDNQQVRVDIMSTTGDILGVGTGVLQNLFITNAGQQQVQTVNLSNVELSAFAGQTIRLRVASTNNRGQLLVGLENVRLQATLSDGVSPTLTGLGLRNPSFLSDLTPVVQATDATFVGQVGDNAGPNNIRQITFDVNNDGFGNSDDVVTTTIDAQGRFSFTLPDTTLPGPRTVTVRVTDRAGNFFDQAFTFIIQGPSLVTWTSQGPGPVNIASEGLNYQTAAGKITSLATDPRDPSGNTIYIGAPNGGVWKTVNGGKDWQAMTDNVTTSTGERIATPIGALAITPTGVIYAATGVEDNSFTSRSSNGILRSTNEGRSWTVLGQNTFRGAQIAKMVVDPRNDNVVYVAVTGWDDTTKQPGIFKTTNGGQTWTNILIPTNMFLPGRVNTLPAGEALASVTDMILDPFSPDRLLIGLGNIGKRTANNTAGVWKTIDGGQTWEKQVGGDDTSIPFNTIPEGTVVGRVTLAQGNGRVGDERFVYVLMSTPPTSTFNAGDTLGLYKSKDNLLNFTKVMLTEEDPLSARGSELFNPIQLHGREGANVGALIVDPSNPNVVYVGGSRRFTQAGDAPQHGVIRVDTGNMRDTTYRLPDLTIPNDGDDITKALTALNMATPNTYPPPDQSTPGAAYTGEGVYWYDIEMDGVNDGSNLRRLAPSVYAMAFDGQGRLLMGTVHGIFRGVSRGYGYDFTTGGGLGIVRGRQQNFNPAGMDITQLNGNLQIADLTSAAIDPNDRSRLYVSAADIGTALTNDGQLAWVTSGLNGNGSNSDTPSAFQVVVAPPTPGAPADALTTVYRVWQNRGIPGGLIPESSSDSGETFGALASAGISINETAGAAPVLAVNPTKVEVAGQFYDELLFGTSRVYLTRTSSNVWDQISPRLSATGFVSALAFAPSASGVYYAGTDDGGVYYQAPGLNWPLRATGLPTGVRINGLTVDPNNANVAYAMLGGRNGIAHVYKTTNAGQSWSALGGTGLSRLPDVSAYSMVIDKRALPGAPNGLIYVGTDVGVYATTDGGATWAPFGQGLPTVPVVNLEFNQTQEQLLAATQGRGVFSISTARSGPYVTEGSPTTPQGQQLTDITVKFNTPIDPRTLTPNGNVQARLEYVNSLVVTVEYRSNRVAEMYRTYLRRAADAGGLNALSPILAQPNGDARVVATLVASAEYFNNPALGNGSNATWLNKAYLDLFGRGTAGDPTAASRLSALNAGTLTRQQVADALVGDDEYRRTLAASLLTKHLGLSYSTPAPTDDTRINGLVTQLKNNGGSVAALTASILSSEEYYRKMGGTVALPVGSVAKALAYGNFTGTRDVVGNFIPDMAVALDTNVVQIYRGRVGGGYDVAPALTLQLPANASPVDLLVADFNKDGLDDLAVANSGLAGAGSLSVFLNTRTTAGQISFGTRSDLNGGNSPVGLAVANIDNDPAGNLDLMAVASVLNGANNYVVSVLLGNGDGTFTGPTVVKVGDNNPASGEITAPTGIAVAHVTGDNKPDLIVSGTNGVAVLTNTTAVPGTPLFAPLTNRVSNVGATSVAAGRIDSNTTNDIVFTTESNGGQVIVLQNDGASGFTATGLTSGASPRSVQLRDFENDGKVDIVVANAQTDGTVAILRNRTVPATAGADTVLFDAAVFYATEGNTPTVARLADTNQDGRLDVGVAHQSSPHVNVLKSASPGKLRVPSDQNWLQAATLGLYGRPANSAELNGLPGHFLNRSLVTLSGPGGTYSPVAIEPADELGQAYTLKFGPLTGDGTYTLYLGTSQTGAVVKDLVDRDGTFVNIGNAINQNRNGINGEFPGDRYTAQYAVTSSDTGRFLTELYASFLGRDPLGRSPDTGGFVALHSGLEAANLQALASFAPGLAGSQESRVRDIGDAYSRYLRRTLSPLSASNPEVAGWLNALNAGQITQFDLVINLVASGEYFSNPSLGNGSNATWVNQVYLDLLGRPVEAGNGFAAQLNAGLTTRAQVARTLLFSDEGLARVVADNYQGFLSRNPARNADPALDETVAWRSLLRQGAAPGLTPLERFRVALVSSVEFLRLVGNSDKDWIIGAYTRLLRRTGVSLAQADVSGALSSLVNLYAPQRQSVATTLLNSPEYRARVISRYYAENLSTPTTDRVATSAEIAAWENVYQTQGGRLETILAGILALDEYVPLNISSNSTWINRVYNSFLLRSAAGDPGAQSFLNFLNSQPLSQLSAARRQVALQLLNSDEYRQILVAGYYNTLLGRNKLVPPGANDAEVNAWVGQMRLGLKQEGLMAIFIGTTEYFLLNT